MALTSFSMPAYYASLWDVFTASLNLLGIFVLFARHLCPPVVMISPFSCIAAFTRYPEAMTGIGALPTGARPFSVALSCYLAVFLSPKHPLAPHPVVSNVLQWSFHGSSTCPSGHDWSHTSHHHPREYYIICVRCICTFRYIIFVLGTVLFFVFAALMFNCLWLVFQTRFSRLFSFFRLPSRLSSSLFYCSDVSDSFSKQIQTTFPE